jgi:predicted permease
MAWLNRLRNLARSDHHSREVDREFDFHIQERADDLVAQGLSREVALAEARRRFGNRGAQKERTRDADLFPVVDSIRGDVRYAVRALIASPVFTIVTIASLALGIGANTTIFSLIDSLILRSLPVADPDGLLRVTLGRDHTVLTVPMWQEFRNRQRELSAVFAVGGFRSDLSTTGLVRPVRGSWVSGEFFPALGIRPAVGRLIGPTDDGGACPPIAVLGHAFWRTQYGADSSVVGRTISLAGNPFRIVGVAEERFFGIAVGTTDALYAPLCAKPVLQPRALDLSRDWSLTVMGRRGAGVSPGQLAAGLATISRPVLEASLPPNLSEKEQAELLALRFTSGPGGLGTSLLRMEFGTVLYALAAIVGIVLLVACANVANLLLARGAARRREVAVRLALGASRARLARQLLTESLLLALSGAVLGVVIAHWGGRVLVSLISGNGTIFLDLSVNWRILGFACAIGVATALLFGVVPALRETRVDPQEAMKSSGRGLSAGLQRTLIGKALVASQLALALVVIVAAGLLLETFRRLSTLDPGFHAERVLMVNTRLRDESLTAEQVEAIRNRLLEAFRATPGVESVTTMNATPIDGSFGMYDVRVGGSSGSEFPEVRFNWVGASYFTTLGMRLLAGREFTADDRRSSPRVAVVNQSAARLLFGNRNPIGLTYQTRRKQEFNPPVTVIGIVNDAKYSSLRQKPPATVYEALEQLEPFSPSFGLRTSVDPAALTTTVTAVATSVEPRVRLRVWTLSDQLRGSLTRERMLALLSTFFGGLTLLLATMGVYGILAYEVSRRRNEFGIRIAVGATPSRLVSLVSLEIGKLVGVGLAAGGAIAFASTRFIRSFLYDMTPTDPWVLGASVALLIGVACVAGLTPALRASRVDPVFALREE